MKTGRPTVKTPKTMDKVLNAISKGATKKQAAECASISPTTLNEMEREFPSFAQDITRAREALEGTLLDRIEQAGREPKFWAANVALLKLIFPTKYGTKIKISGDLDQPAVQVEWSQFSSAQIRELIKAAA